MASFDLSRDFGSTLQVGEGQSPLMCFGKLQSNAFIGCKQNLISFDDTNRIFTMKNRIFFTHSRLHTQCSSAMRGNGVQIIPVPFLQG
jgi:hypothetical protein